MKLTKKRARFSITSCRSHCHSRLQCTESGLYNACRVQCWGFEEAIKIDRSRASFQASGTRLHCLSFPSSLPLPPKLPSACRLRFEPTQLQYTSYKRQALTSTSTIVMYTYSAEWHWKQGAEDHLVWSPWHYVTSKTAMTDLTAHPNADIQEPPPKMAYFSPSPSTTKV